VKWTALVDRDGSMGRTAMVIRSAQLAFPMVSTTVTRPLPTARPSLLTRCTVSLPTRDQVRRTPLDAVSLVPIHDNMVGHAALCIASSAVDISEAMQKGFLSTNGSNWSAVGSA